MIIIKWQPVSSFNTSICFLKYKIAISFGHWIRFERDINLAAISLSHQHSPAFPFCSLFNCVREKNWKFRGLLGLSCWGSGGITAGWGVWGSEALAGHCPSIVTGTWLLGEQRVELRIWLSTEDASTFCCIWEKATRDCMALLKVSWCWTSWRTHLERPEIQKTHTSEKKTHTLPKFS